MFKKKKRVELKVWPEAPISYIHLSVTSTGSWNPLEVEVRRMHESGEMVGRDGDGLKYHNEGLDSVQICQCPLSV